MAKLSSNGKVNAVLPLGTRRVQPFLIGSGGPCAASFRCHTPDLRPCFTNVLWPNRLHISLWANIAHAISIVHKTGEFLRY